MVRLLPDPISRQVGANVFQSHNGAIAARKKSEGGFGSDMVSIPQWCDCCRTDKPVAFCFAFVSIPQWCDCCEELKACQVLAAPVSIPQWCDCCLFDYQKDILRQACFNPTMVRLLPTSRLNLPCNSSSFNPTMVRLLRQGWTAHRGS